MTAGDIAVTGLPGSLSKLRRDGSSNPPSFVLFMIESSSVEEVLTPPSKEGCVKTVLSGRRGERRAYRISGCHK